MKSILIFLVTVALISISCSPEPQPINFGEDECVLCKMIVAQEPWGAEIVTTKSRTVKFDAVECMAKYINDGYINSEDVHSCWVIDYGQPGELINADDALFLRSRTLPSPMAMFLTSFSSKVKLDETMRTHKGEVMNWDEVKKIVKAEWGD